MKKICYLLISLFILYFAVQIAFVFFGTGHSIHYKVNDFNIKETLTQNKKNETDNYYFEIEKDDILFNFQIMNIKQGSKLIKEIKYFKNTNYECMIPIFRIKGHHTDLVCKKDGIYYYYNTIRGNDPEIDNFAQEYVSEYVDNLEVKKENGNLYVYSNLIDNHFIGLEYYKGIYDINKKANYKKISLFRNEKYTKELSTIVDKYYISADYDQEYDFHNFELINLETYTVSKITSNSAISLNSYIQGVVDNSLYILDKSNKKQYEINLKTKEVIEIGNESIGIKIYKDNEFVNGNIYEAISNNIMFNDNTMDSNFNNKIYSKVEKVGNKLSGYYYLYEKANNIYRVYRASIMNTNVVTYLFDTTDIDSVKYVDEYVYYIYNSEIKYFNETTGNKTVLKYNDMEYNKGLKYYVYSK